MYILFCWRVYGMSQENRLQSSFSPLGMWAFSIGTSIGWGSFIVTCNAYLQKAGILGTMLGLLIGMAVISVITWNLQYMIRTLPNACGMAKYNNDQFVASVFERADQQMYDNKNSLKSRGGVGSVR